ncbi:MAG: LysR family transcriptional regulator [Roseiarcus sp.]
MNLSAVDLNLLPALEALLRRRNVTRAAADVGLSQPAMSRALARLRQILDDPLLVRGPNGLAPTSRAQELAPRLGAALEAARSVFRAQPFEPAGLRRTIRVAASDVQTVLLAPAIMARLARIASGVDLVMEPYGPDVRRRMEEGSLDLAFALASTPLPPGAWSEAIGVDRLALAMRRGHPAANRAWTLADYGRFDHVAVALLRDGESDMDARLAAAGVSRRIALTTPHFIAALASVAATDMVTTVSATLARRFAAPFGLLMRAPPFDDVTLPMTLVGAAARANDPTLRWFCALTREVADSIFREEAAFA